MPTTTLVPDAILASTNLTGTVDKIDEVLVPDNAVVHSGDPVTHNGDYVVHTP